MVQKVIMECDIKPDGCSGVQRKAGAPGVDHDEALLVRQGVPASELPLVLGPLHQAVQQAADYHSDLPLTLDKVAGACFDFARTHPTFYRLQMGLWYTPPESESFQAVAPWNARLHTTVEQLFAQAAEQHGNMRGRQRAYAATFLGMIQTYAGLALNGYTRLEEPLVYQAVHQFMHGIFS